MRSSSARSSRIISVRTRARASLGVSSSPRPRVPSRSQLRLTRAVAWSRMAGDGGLVGRRVGLDEPQAGAGGGPAARSPPAGRPRAGRGRARRARRASAGRVEPCSSSVPTVTTSAMTTSSARSGVSSGRVSAAARVTTPRMPAQEPTTPPRSRSARSTVASARRLVSRVNGIIHSGRSTRQVRSTTTPTSERSPRRQVLVVHHVVEQPGDLQADEEEDRVLQDERDARPVDPLGQPRGRGLQHRCLVGQQQAGGHHGEHARGADPLGRDVGEVGRDEGQGGVGRHLGEVLAHQPDDEERGHPDGHAADRGDEQVDADRRDRHLRGVLGALAHAVRHEETRRRQCGAQGDQGGGVVEQRLALEDGGDPPREADPAGHGGGGHGIRWGDDRPPARAPARTRWAASATRRAPPRRR